MMRKKTGFKELTLVVLCSAALVSVACGDDDATDGDGLAGSAGSAGSSGSATAGSKSTGGSAGSKSTGGSGGTGAGGTGGTNTAGTSNGGSAGSSVGGVPSTGGVPGEGGAGEGGVPSEGGAGEGGANMGGAGGEGGDAPEPIMDTLLNWTFEAPIPPATWPPSTDTTVFPEWVNTTTPADAAYISWDKPKTGSVKLAHWKGVAYTARTEQTVAPIANGMYSVSIWANRDLLTDLNESYLYAKGYSASVLDAITKANTDAAVGDPWVKITLPPVEVTSGAIIIGVYTDATAGSWINFDDASLERLPD